MKRFLPITVLAFVLFSFAFCVTIPLPAGDYATVRAVDAPPQGTPFVELGVMPNRSITIMLLVHNEGDPVWIETNKGVFEKVSIPSTGMPQYGSYKSELEVLRVYGNLKVFDSSENGGFVKYIDASHCPKLVKLYGLHNSMSHVDISSCKELEFVNLAGSDLKAIDVKNNTNLKTLWLPKNNISTLDLTGLLQLEELSFEQNGLSQVNGLSDLSKLVELRCDGNKFIDLDCSKMSNLEQLFASKNNLKDLDLSKSPKLKVLDVSFNYITELKIASNALESVSVHHNKLGDTQSTALVNSLPSRLGKEPGTLIWFNNEIAHNEDPSGNYPEKNSLNDKNVAKALEKNWVTYSGDQVITSSKPITESSFSCWGPQEQKLLLPQGCHRVDIFDVTGKLVASYPTPGEELSLSVHPSGTYVASIHFADMVESIVFIKGGSIK